MKVYIGCECYWDYCNEFRSVVKVFDCEEKALIWKEEFKSTETEYRTYHAMEVE